MYLSILINQVRAMNNLHVKIILFLILVCNAPNFAQITVGVNTLPDVGDELEYAHFTFNGDTSSYRQNGANLTWNYTLSSIDSTSTEAYLDIEGTPAQDSFPSANMLVSGIGIEAAALRTANSISILGFVGGPIGFIGGGAIRFSDPLTIREVPIEYGDAFADSVTYSFTVSSALLGLDTVMIMGATIDSLRFNFKIVMKAEATAWGNVTVNGTSADVLKISHQEITENGLELGVNFAGNIIWIDGSLLFGDAFGGREISRGYSFLSADSKASIIEFEEQEVPIDTMGNTETIVTGRMRSDLATSVGDIPQIAGLELSPNPADDWIQLNSDIDLYLANYKILTLDGKTIQSGKIRSNNILEIGQLSFGSYILEVRTSDQFGVLKFVKN